MRNESMPNWSTYATIAGTGTAANLTAALLMSGSTFMERVRVSVETAPIRFTLDGTTPVAVTTGELADVGASLELFGQETREFAFINETGLASSLRCHGGIGEGKLP
jgi:hypothetical protein